MCMCGRWWHTKTFARKFNIIPKDWNSSANVTHRKDATSELEMFERKNVNTFVKWAGSVIVSKTQDAASHVQVTPWHTGRLVMLRGPRWMAKSSTVPRIWSWTGRWTRRNYQKQDPAWIIHRCNMWTSRDQVAFENGKVIQQWLSSSAWLLCICAWIIWKSHLRKNALSQSNLILWYCVNSQARC